MALGDPARPFGSLMSFNAGPFLKLLFVSLDQTVEEVLYGYRVLLDVSQCTKFASAVLKKAGWSLAVCRLMSLSHKLALCVFF